MTERIRIRDILLLLGTSCLIFILHAVIGVGICSVVAFFLQKYVFKLQLDGVSAFLMSCAAGFGLYAVCMMIGQAISDIRGSDKEENPEDHNK